jgi:hypothetical protein
MCATSLGGQVLVGFELLLLVWLPSLIHTTQQARAVRLAEHVLLYQKVPSGQCGTLGHWDYHD